ncbi:hypothetical protein F4778DRAFT_753698 [Xylariomycetidae sp. FL2044]|nr:hypothetical protein F4778DRAFT_753698 [Xylariomycetidae sp. FL2044]
MRNPSSFLLIPSYSLLTKSSRFLFAPIDLVQDCIYSRIIAIPLCNTRHHRHPKSHLQPDLLPDLLSAPHNRRRVSNSITMAESTSLSHLLDLPTEVREHILSQVVGPDPAHSPDPLTANPSEMGLICVPEGLRELSSIRITIDAQHDVLRWLGISVSSKSPAAADGSKARAWPFYARNLDDPLVQQIIGNITRVDKVVVLLFPWSATPTTTTCGLLDKFLCLFAKLQDVVTLLRQLKSCGQLCVTGTFDQAFAQARLHHVPPEYGSLASSAHQGGRYLEYLIAPFAALENFDDIDVLGAFRLRDRARVVLPRVEAQGWWPDRASTTPVIPSAESDQDEKKGSEIEKLEMAVAHRIKREGCRRRRERSEDGRQRRDNMEEAACARACGLAVGLSRDIVTLVSEEYVEVEGGDPEVVSLLRRLRVEGAGLSGLNYISEANKRWRVGDAADSKEEEKEVSDSGIDMS